MALDVRSRYLIDAKVTGQAGLDSFGRSLANVDKQGKATAAALKGSAATISEIVAGAGIAIGLTEATSALIDFGKSSIEAGLNLERLGVQLKFATGTTEGAANAYRFLRQITDELGLDFDATSRAFAKFGAAAKGTSIEGEETRRIFESVAQAVSVMRLSASDTEGVFLALSQMLSKGKVQAEELRGQLGERLPGAFKIAADAMGVSTAALDKMLKNGEVFADDFLPRFGQQMRKVFGGDVPEASDTASASINRLSNEWEKLKAGLSNSEAVKGAADFLRQILIGAQASLGLDKTLEAQLELGNAYKERADAVHDYIEALDEANRADVASPQQLAELEDAEQRIRDAEAAVESLTAAYNELAGVNVAPSSSVDRRELEGKGKEKLKALRDEYSAFMEDFATKSEKAAKEVDAFRKRFETVLNPAELAAGIASIRDKFKDHAATKRDADADAIDAAERQVMQTQNLAHAEETLFEIQRGRYATLKPETQARLMQLAEELDLLDELKQETEAQKQLDDDAAKERERDATERERRRDSVRREIDDLHNQAAAIGLSAKEAAEFAFSVDLIRQGFAAGSAEFNRFMAEYRSGIAELEERQGNWALGARAALKDYSDAAKNVAGQTYDFVSNQFAGLEEVAANFARTGKLSFKDFALSAIADLNRLIFRITTLGPLANFLSSLFGGGSGLPAGIMNDPNGALPGRARGGGVTAGRAYMVGEEGPEPFIPNQSGTIIPNGALGGINVSVVVNQNGGSTDSAVSGGGSNGRQFGESLAAAIRGVIVDEARAGGAIDRVVRGRR